MSFNNQNIQNRFNNNITFHGLRLPSMRANVQQSLQRPPLLPYPASPYNVYMPLNNHPPPPQAIQTTDQEYLKQWETKIQGRILKKTSDNKFVIGILRKHLRNIVQALNELKQKESNLQTKMITMSDDEWQENVKQIDHHKTFIENAMMQLNDNCIQKLRNDLTKRTAKRMRQKQLRIKNKKDKEQQKRDWEEKSRIIDEKLQKVKDSFIKIKQVSY